MLKGINPFELWRGRASALNFLPLCPEPSPRNPPPLIKHLPAPRNRPAAGPRRAPLICAASIALFAASHLPSVSAATVTWTGAGGDANWTTAANWGGTAPVAGDALTFDGTTQLTDTNNFAAATTFLGITFNAGAGSFVLSGNSIDSTGGIVNNSLNLQTVNLDLIFASTHTLNSITGGTMVIGGVISGAGGTTKTGGGTVTLTRANTYTGATAVNAGTLKLDFAAAGAPATNIISASSALQMGGGTLSIQGVAGGASTQAMASTTFNAGLSAITVTPGAAGTASLALGNIVHNTNAAVRFGTTGTVTAGTVSATTGGLLGLPSGTGGVNFATAGYATYGLDDFAAISAGTIVGGISVAGFYQNTYGANFDMLANTTLANGGAQRAANVVRWNTPTATTLTGGTSNLVTFTGALITPNMGANNAVFNTGAGGVWQVVRTTNPNGAQQGTIWQNNTLGYFNVSIPIVDGREGVSDPTQIVKAGAGTAVFSGVNTYTGRTSIYEGALMIGADNNLGAVADPLTISGGTLLSSATFALSTTRAITVGGGGTGGLAATTGNTLTIGSVVGGTGEVAVGLGTVAGSGAGTANTTAVLGDGKVVLTAANTYSGGTSVNAGTLNVNGINALGGANYGGLKIAGGTLQYATTLTSGSDFSTGRGVNLGAGGGTIDTNGNAVSYAFGIAGAGGLTKIGNNTLTLSAAGTYTGGTVINGGTLKVAANSATGTGAVTVNSGGTLAGTGTLGGAVTVNTGGTLDPGASVGTLTVPGLTLGVDALLRFEFNISPANDQVVVTGLNGLTLNGGKFSLFAEGTATAWGTDGSYNLFSYNGAILGTGTSALTVINGAAGHSYTFGSGGGFVTLTVATVGVISNWALATGGTWNLAGNWSNGVPDQISATANLGAALGAAGTVTLDGGRTVGGLTFSNANSYTVASGTGGALTFQKSSGSADAMVLSGSHTISAPVVLASNLAADIAASSTLNVSGQVSGAQSLTKRGNGTLVLGSANLYSLGTTLEAGTLELGDANALGTAALSVTGSATVRAGAAALAPAYNVSLVGAVTATVDSQANTFTLTGIVSNTAGNGALTKTGSGTVVLAGTNTYGGATTVSAGTLSVGDVQDGGIASSIGQSSAVAGNLVLNGGTLSYTGAGASTNRLFTIGTAGGTIAASGSGALNFTDVAPLTLTGADTARTLTLTGTSGASNTLFPALGDNGLGATSLTKSGAGTWQLSGTNTFTGQTVISGGTLALGHALALQNSTLNYNNQGGALSFGPFTAVTFGNLTGGQTAGPEQRFRAGRDPDRGQCADHHFLRRSHRRRGRGQLADQGRRRHAEPDRCECLHRLDHGERRHADARCRWHHQWRRGAGERQQHAERERRHAHGERVEQRGQRGPRTGYFQPLVRQRHLQRRLERGRQPEPELAHQRHGRNAHGGEPEPRPLGLELHRGAHRRGDGHGALHQWRDRERRGRADSGQRQRHEFLRERADRQRESDRGRHHQHRPEQRRTLVGHRRERRHLYLHGYRQRRLHRSPADWQCGAFDPGWNGDRGRHQDGPGGQRHERRQSERRLALHRQRRHRAEHGGAVGDQTRGGDFGGESRLVFAARHAVARHPDDQGGGCRRRGAWHHPGWHPFRHGRGFDQDRQRRPDPERSEYFHRSHAAQRRHAQCECRHGARRRRQWRDPAQRRGAASRRCRDHEHADLFARCGRRDD